MRLLCGQAGEVVECSVHVEADGHGVSGGVSGISNAPAASMHDDEMQGEADEEVDEEEADRQAEEAAFQPFEPDDCSAPGEGFEVAHCPERLPNDIKVADKLALWFGPPYNTWHVGNVAEVNYRRTKSENVSVEFKDDTDGDRRDARQVPGHGRHVRCQQAVGAAQADRDQSRQRQRRGRGWRRIQRRCPVFLVQEAQG